MSPNTGSRDSGLERAALVAEAETWVRTPYHHHARVKGAGVDCANLITECYFNAGLAPRFKVEKYNHDWHLHRDEERYLAKVEEYLTRIDDTELPLLERDEDFFVLPGNVIVWRIGRTYSHGAIVSKWPTVIHASFPSRSVVKESVRGTVMERKPMRVYSLWGA